MSSKAKTDLNKLLREMMGPRMTRKEKALYNLLRLKVKAKEITVNEAHATWDRLVLKKEVSS